MGNKYVPNQIQEKILSGEKEEKVGPGEYEVKTTLVEPHKKGFDFGKSKTTRELYRQSPTQILAAPG